mgnify:CR=1 FL=1
MRNVMKAATLESKLPLLAVEGGCIISKDADITVAFRVELPNTKRSTLPGARLFAYCPITASC